MSDDAVEAARRQYRDAAARKEDAKARLDNARASLEAYLGAYLLE